MKTVSIEKRPAEWYYQQLEAKQPLTFSRWGDGEWRSALGLAKVTARNCDKHTFFPKMGADLAAVLRRRPGYVLGMQALGYRQYQGQIDAFLKREKLTDLAWTDADVFHYAAIRKEISPLFRVLRRRRLIVVGPHHLRRLSEWMPLSDFVEVPQQDCYLQLDRLVVDVYAALRKSPEPAVVSVSASMPAEILLDRLHQMAGHLHSFIDFGSLWDQFVGVESRRYMSQTHELPGLVRQQLG